MTPFVRWGPAHVLAIVLSIALPLLLAGWARRDPTGRRAHWGARGFGIVLIVHLAILLIWGRRGRPTVWIDLIPAHLCDWALWACILASLARHRLSCELAYFWGLAGTLQGLITPDLHAGFPAPQFFSFFLGHGGIVATVLFLVAGLGFRPDWSSVRRAYAGLLVYALFAFAVNTTFGTNFGYLRMKPGVPSLLDHLGPWPWYLASLAVLGLANFALLQAPWTISAWLRRSRRAGPSP